MSTLDTHEEKEEYLGGEEYLFLYVVPDLSELGICISIVNISRRRSEGEEDLQCLLESAERKELIDSINDEIRVKHPICYDMYELCERYHSNKLEFNVAMLKAICSLLSVAGYL